MGQRHSLCSGEEHQTQQTTWRCCRFPCENVTILGENEGWRRHFHIMSNKTSYGFELTLHGFRTR